MSPETFALKDCALIAIATGRRAQSLKELRYHLQEVPESCIYHHFWGHLLEPRFDEPEYNNDFAGWVRHALHDKPLAERMAVVDPGTYPDLEALRQELLDAVEERIDESEIPLWSRSDRQFEFLHSKIVVFDTHRRVSAPEEFTEIMPHISSGSVFYHFIDARRRNASGADDFCLWIESFDDAYTGLADKLRDIDPYFLSLTDLRDQLTAAFREFFRSQL